MYVFIILAYTLLLLTLPLGFLCEDFKAAAIVVRVVVGIESHMQYRGRGRFWAFDLDGLVNASDMQQLQLQLQSRQHSKYRENIFFIVLSYESKTLLIVSCLSPISISGSSSNPAARIVYLSKRSKQYWYNDRNSKISASGALTGGATLAFVKT